MGVGYSSVAVANNVDNDQMAAVQDVPELNITLRTHRVFDYFRTYTTSARFQFRALAAQGGEVSV